MTVVAMDGEYVKPHSTSVVMILPGQSMDVFISCIGENVIPNPGRFVSSFHKLDSIS